MSNSPALLWIVSLCFCLTSTLHAQPTPASAQAFLYFPQLVDGGPSEGRWQTRLTFINPNDTATTATVFFFSDEGRGLQLNFGDNDRSQLQVTIPAYGTKVFTSAMTSQTTVAGWALAIANLPVLGNIAFRQITNATRAVELTSNPTLPTGSFLSYANAELGIALANPSITPQSISLIVKDTEGRPVGQKTMALASFGHTAFNLGGVINLPSGFRGSVLITGATAQDRFIVWTLNSENGALSSLPEGRFQSPVSHFDRVSSAFARVLVAAQKNMGIGADPISLDIRTSNLFVLSATNTSLVIGLAVSELMSDSEAEVAFLLAHELGHVYQQRAGHSFSPVYAKNQEADADLFGMITMLLAGYDPYAATGALAKLAMVTGQPSLITQFEGASQADAHKSLNDRVAGLYTLLSAACASTPTTQAACALYRDSAHPHFPTPAPLSFNPVQQ